MSSGVLSVENFIKEIDKKDVWKTTELRDLLLHMLSKDTLMSFHRISDLKMIAMESARWQMECRFLERTVESLKECLKEKNPNS